MATTAESTHIANQARQRYVDALLKGLPGVVVHVGNGARTLLDKPAEHLTAQRRRDLLQGLLKQAGGWRNAMVIGLRHVLLHGSTQVLPSEMPPARGDPLSLVDNDTIEREILTSRLALAIMDRAGWEFTDLRSRVAMLERRGELDTHDMLRAHILARVVLDGWRAVGLSATDWREAQPLLHEGFATLAEEAYHETNHWLITQKVMPDVDLRNNIKRHVQPTAPGGFGPASGPNSGPESRTSAGFSGPGGSFGNTTQASGRMPPAQAGRADDNGAARSRAGGSGSGWADTTLARHAPARSARTGGQGELRGDHLQGNRYDAVRLVGQHAGHRSAGREVGEETRMMTRPAPMSRGSDHAEAVMGRLNRLVGRHLPGFADTTHGRPVTNALALAIDNAQQNLRKRFLPGGDAPAPGADGQPVTGQTGAGQQHVAPLPTGPMLLEELQAGKQALKKAASTPAERATIEIVAMMFQSILAEDSIPAAMRVWFARLQMPVLRVAVGEPDFFATLDHPARRLIDRMGACVMGLDSASRNIGDALEKEIKRVVQVVEADPDTGRRVFQTVLVEFEKFLEHFFKNENEASKRGVSLAQQVEQRETLAIQYTIELRRMLNEVPVQEGVRQFLFQVWADVLATSAVRYGGQAAETKTMKRAAADLIWSASAKVTREERAEVIRRLPPLLKRLREGMSSANMSAERQDERINALNNALAAAFTAKAAVIPNDRLQDLMERLESLEELLPGAEDIEIDESLVLDLSGHESAGLEVVSDGGSMPSAPMLAWARELLVGSWYTLEYRNRHEPVQLAWHGLRRQLTLFVTPKGRCVLFQQQRLAAFLQAGLLLPAQEESLTVKATRNALAKLDADPSRLMN